MEAHFWREFLQPSMAEACSLLGPLLSSKDIASSLLPLFPQASPLSDIRDCIASEKSHISLPLTFLLSAFSSLASVFMASSSSSHFYVILVRVFFMHFTAAFYAFRLLWGFWQQRYSIYFSRMYQYTSLSRLAQHRERHFSQKTTFWTLQATQECLSLKLLLQQKDSSSHIEETFHFYLYFLGSSFISQPSKTFQWIARQISLRGQRHTASYLHLEPLHLAIDIHWVISFSLLSHNDL